MVDITIEITEGGRAWTVKETARLSHTLTAEDDAPLSLVQRQLEALGYTVTMIQSLGLHVMAEVVAREVTAENVTDERIRELQAGIVAFDSADDALDAACNAALYGPAEQKTAARARCAAAINARRGGQP